MPCIAIRFGGITMRFLKCLPFISILVSPQILLAAEQDQHRYTQKEQIVFSEATRTAFDHSGKAMTRTSQVDGSQAVQNNGSAGNVTVARLGPDGNIETYCTTDIESARSWMAGEGASKTKVSIGSPVMEKKP